MTNPALARLARHAANDRHMARAAHAAAAEAHRTAAALWRQADKAGTQQAYETAIEATQDAALITLACPEGPAKAKANRASLAAHEAESAEAAAEAHDAAEAAHRGA